MTIRDFPCTYDNAVGINPDATRDLDISFPEVYQHCDSMAKLSRALKDYTHAAFCELPFCHTVEAEALGGHVHLGDATAGPRASTYVYTDMHELLELPDIDCTQGRIAETLAACQILTDAGEHVVYEISGPFTILNGLIDARAVFKAFRKEPELMEGVFVRLGEAILAHMEAAKAHGAEFLSYADPSGGVNILGPRLMEQVTESFTVDLVHRAAELADDTTMLLLCPKTSFALIQTGHAEFVNHKLSAPMRFGEACIEMLGRVGVAGQNCIKNIDFELGNALFKEVSFMKA